MYQLYCFNESVSVTFLYYTFGVTGVYDLFLFQADENYIFNYLIKNKKVLALPLDKWWMLQYKS